MKRILLIVILFLVGCMPPKLATPLTEQQMSHQVVFTTNLPSDEVYDMALEWMAKNFVSSKAVIEYKDKSSGNHYC